MFYALPQLVTYWPPEGLNDYGKAVFGRPLVLRCLWQDKQEKMTSADGDEFVSKAQTIISEPVSLGGYLCLGDHRLVLDPRTIDAHEVRGAYSVPDLRNLRQTHKAIL